jgi:hypothetical protein
MNAWYLSVGVTSCSLIVAPEAALAASARPVMPAFHGGLVRIDGKLLGTGGADAQRGREADGPDSP